MASSYAKPAAGALHPAAYNAAEAITRRHAKSFHFASFFLPKEIRRHAFAVYAFCRNVDDTVDAAGDPDTKRRKLDEADRMLDAIYDGRMPDGLRGERLWAVEAFAETVQQCGIERRLFDELLTGVRIDLNQSRFADWIELERYCYHVAGVVGVMMCRVFGLKDRSAEPQAIAMGNAMQMTNILRDVGEDYRRGRVYLPQDELARFGVSEQDLAAGRVTPQWVELMRYQMDRTKRLYREGASGIHKLPPNGARRTASVMAVVYAGIVDKIETLGFDVFSQRAALNGGEKLARLPMARRLWTRRPHEPVPQFTKLVTRGMQP